MLDDLILLFKSSDQIAGCRIPPLRKADHLPSAPALSNLFASNETKVRFVPYFYLKLSVKFDAEWADISLPPCWYNRTFGSKYRFDIIGEPKKLAGDEYRLCVHNYELSGVPGGEAVQA